ncbi:MAG: acyltransferase domain-containing protein, partial [Acidobacteriota bacterium]
MALPTLFAVEYACARLLMSWGLVPAAVAGHSMGEYVAACLAGVFTLEDSLAIVVRRAQLFDELPSGGMTSVPLPATDVEPLLGDRLAFAAINSPEECVVAGPVEALDAFERDLLGRGLETRRLKIDVAAHSPMIDLILPRFRTFLETLPMSPPTIPLIANVTGGWMSAEQACDPDYWARHLRQTVRFGDGVETLLAEPDFVFVEVGPGRALTTLAKRQVDRDQFHRFVASMRHPMDKTADDAHLALALGKLWAAGVDIEWGAYYGDERRLRVPLPTYPFERERFWIEPGEGRASTPVDTGKSADLSTWPHVLGWERRAPLPAAADLTIGDGPWLLFDDGEWGRALAGRLAAEGVDLVRVTAGPSFVAGEGGHYTLRPGIRADYDTLIRELAAAGRAPRRVVHCWGIVDGDEGFAATADLGFHSLLFVQQALDAQGLDAPVTFDVLARGLEAVESGDRVNPDLATLLGPCLVLPQEHPNLTVRLVDVDQPETPADRARRVEDLIAHLASDAELPRSAWRGRHAWTPRFDAIELPEPAGAAFTEGGTYLITGGLGGVGLLLARHLAESAKVRLVLTSRRGLPPREMWGHAADD